MQGFKKNEDKTDVIYNLLPRKPLVRMDIKFQGRRVRCGEKGALMEVNALKQCALKVSQSGLLRVMGDGGGTRAQNLWGYGENEEGKEKPPAYR